MPQWKGIVGQSFTPEAFKQYVAGLDLSDMEATICGAPQHARPESGAAS